MADSDEVPQTQKTAKGLEIPVPSRDEFLRDLQRVAPPAKPAIDEKPKR